MALHQPDLTDWSDQPFSAVKLLDMIWLGRAGVDGRAGAAVPFQPVAAVQDGLSPRTAKSR
jgi:hypothetical protein